MNHTISKNIDELMYDSINEYIHKIKKIKRLDCKDYNAPKNLNNE